MYLLSQMLPHLETLSCEYKCEEIGHICSTCVAFEAPLSFQRCKIERILQVTYSINARNVFFLTSMILLGGNYSQSLVLWLRKLKSMNFFLPASKHLPSLVVFYNPKKDVLSFVYI